MVEVSAVRSGAKARNRVDGQADYETINELELTVTSYRDLRS
jgi:hypothetical protein